VDVLMLMSTAYISENDLRDEEDDQAEESECNEDHPYWVRVERPKEGFDVGAYVLHVANKRRV
jgi:hypothetical protein